MGGKKKADNDNVDDSYIDDIDDMLVDIHVATAFSVDEDMTVHTVGLSFIKLEPTTFEKLLEDARHLLYDDCTIFFKLSFILNCFTSR